MKIVNLFRAQARNTRSSLEFADFSVKTPYNSTNASYIKQQISERIRACTLTMCLYGPTTYTSPWVTWELERSLELGKPLMGVWLYDDGSIQYYPGVLQGHPLVGWRINEIVATMQSLAAEYRGR